jgi:UDP-N-acetylmuramyl pentapeptide phosphotransferase/UDP-N-acetylglucosamine-1-phosphate transferase
MPDFATLASILVAAAAAGLGVCVLIVGTQRWHGGLSLDANLTGKQKFHKKPVPRIGGVGLLLGITCAYTWAHPGTPGTGWGGTGGTAPSVAALILASLPVFAVGLVEDVTKRVSVCTRLGFTLMGALLAWWLLDAVLPRLDLPLLDRMLTWLPLAVALTAVAVAGVTNAINIIDGFNGLAASTAIAMLSGMAFLGWRCGDPLVVELALLGIGSTVGFLLLNWPLGLLFMGDGGAYFLGFWCAETAVLLVCRNPEVSPWQVLAIHAYPVIEVLYSMFRKKVLRRMSPALPDRLHLHMLVFRRCVCRLVPRASARPWMRNACVAVLIAPWTAAWTTAAVTLATNALPAALLLCLHATAYLAVYVRLVRGHWPLQRSAIFRPLARVLRARSA